MENFNLKSFEIKHKLSFYWCFFCEKCARSKISKRVIQ